MKSVIDRIFIGYEDAEEFTIFKKSTHKENNFRCGVVHVRVKRNELENGGKISRRHKIMGAWVLFIELTSTTNAYKNTALVDHYYSSTIYLFCSWHSINFSSKIHDDKINVIFSLSCSQLHRFCFFTMTKIYSLLCAIFKQTLAILNFYRCFSPYNVGKIIFQLFHSGISW